MRTLPLIIVVGGDDLAVRVCEELCSTRGHEVVLLWEADKLLAERARRAGAQFSGLPPNDYESLREVGVTEAAAVMPVSEDDRLNLQVALKARNLNPAIRIVLRQFNRALGGKIEQNLPDCTAISPAAHAAATYAGAAVDPGCIYALQFPDSEGPLLGFSERAAHEFGWNGISVGEAERRTGLRIVALREHVGPEPNETMAGEDRVVAFGTMEALQAAWPRRRGLRRSRARTSRRVFARDILRAAFRTEPVLIYTFALGTALFFAASVYFMFQLRLNFVEAMYFTASTMLTVGYGDISPYGRHAGTLALLIAVAVMLTGVAVGSVFIATIAATLTRAQETALQGLRRIHAEDHVIVCGAGNVGTRVIDFLLSMRQRVVVIEQRPNALLMEHARARRVELLRADATSDDTLRFCDLRSAQSLIAITDSDTSNLEAALSARVQNPNLPVVMRIMDPDFSRSIERNFKIAKSFSASELTAPAIAGLARFPGTRGRVTFAGETFNVGERSAATRLPRAEGTIPLCAWRAGNLVPIHDFSQMQPDDRLLYIVPLSQFRAQD